ncbi:MAG: 4-alpha-glucanotransferase [Gammaproteobacteria bacterium]
MTDAREGAPDALLKRRRAGLLLHPTSLPGGGLGPDAYRFVEFMAAAGQTVWQTLPLGPTHNDRSPYQCLSVFAGRHALISLEGLAAAGWLEAAPEDEARDDLDRRDQLIAEACKRFSDRASPQERHAYDEFRQHNCYWLDDYSLYQALRIEHDRSSWLEWPAALRDRQAKALDKARQRLAPVIERTCFTQFVFHRQWLELKRYANEHGVLLFGDLPIFVAHDSAEVWARRHYFTLDDHGRALTVAGVPPDYFSATGQYWGNPHYRWDRMQQNGFEWWRRRIEHQLELFDLVRIDHFRGFEAYWEIPAGAETAMEGRWVNAPGDALFTALQASIDPLPLVAEDLGVITAEVDQLRHKFGFPGMKVLQFAFDGGSANPYLPHNHEPDYVVYTGTHDNNTTVGWFNGLKPKDREHVQAYLGYPGEDMPWPLIRAAYESVARLAMVPMQDVLALGDEHRMNVPGVTEGNWGWGFHWQQVPEDLAGRLHALSATYGRTPGQ